MQNIKQLAKDIRDVINRPRHKDVLSQNHAAWHMLCSSLDVIEDTDCCLAAFLKTDIDFDSDNQSLDDGNKYMYVYGTLQALFVQQDAVKHFAESLQPLYTFDSSLINDNPSLKVIREIRNDSVGHPTKRGGGTGRAFNFISCATINNQGFQLATVYTDDTPERSQDVNIPDLIATQRDILMGDLGDILETLRREEMEHKKKFAGKKLADAFPPTLNYHLGKIREAAIGSGYAKLGGANVDFILKRIERFKADLAERQILEAYEGITHDLELVDYPLQELRKYFRNPDATHINEKDAPIFAFFVGEQTKKLLKSTEELDEEYSQDDPENHPS
jgi:hypothetical protein